MSETVYSKLFFDTIAFDDLTDGVNPHLLCPVCRHAWQPKLNLGVNFPAEFDFNQKVTFTIPLHDDVKLAKPCSASGQSVELFVAVRKDSEKKVLQVQRSDAEGAAGIPAAWWVKEA